MIPHTPKFNKLDITEENIELALNLHQQYSTQLAEINRVEQITQRENKYKSEIIKEQQTIQEYLRSYFRAREDGGKQSVYTGTEILQRRKLKINQRDEKGEIVKVEEVHLGIDFIHEQFNEGKLFPIGTFFSLIANSGVGKSDYLYKIANSFLIQGYKTLLCSFEFGDDRLAQLIDSKENGGKDRLREARLGNKLDNFFVNYYSRDLDSLELLIDIAHQNGIRAVFIDSFGEIERTEQEYILQQKVSMMLNRKANDYQMFVCIIAQTKSGEMEGEYTVRGGTDLIYKPDLSIHIKKKSQEDTSGDRIVHLIKNRDSDINGKTIITEYDFEKREPIFKCDFDKELHGGGIAKELKFGKKKK